MKRLYSFLSIIVLFTIVVFCLLAVLCVNTSQAAPFLICDPQYDVTHYIVTIDGVTTTSPAFDLGNGTVRLNVDLKDVSEGKHVCSIKAANEWAESDPAPFIFTRAGPGVLVNVRIE